jgi:hypothetical protein
MPTNGDNRMTDTGTSVYRDPTCCQWCGGYHTTFCPRVKAIEYYDGGFWIKRVEFWAVGEIPAYPVPPYPVAGNK